MFQFTLLPKSYTMITSLRRGRACALCSIRGIYLWRASPSRHDIKLHQILWHKANVKIVRYRNFTVNDRVAFHSQPNDRVTLKLHSNGSSVSVITACVRHYQLITDALPPHWIALGTSVDVHHVFYL